MKKFFVCSFLFYIFSVSAQTGTGDDFLDCPNEKIAISKQAVSDNSTSLDSFCPSEKNAKGALGQYINNEFTEELARFRKDVLAELYQDNRSNPNFVASKAIFELRRHRKCLRDICFILNKCSNNIEAEDPSTSGILSNREKCDQLAEDLFTYQKSIISNYVEENQSRKERSLLQQKLTAISVRFQNYLIPLLGDARSELSRFSGKITNLLKTPKK